MEKFSLPGNPVIDPCRKTGGSGVVSASLPGKNYFGLDRDLRVVTIEKTHVAETFIAKPRTALMTMDY
jgi:hypothetical protein